MGKPYSSEIRILPSTYEWALSCNVDFLASVIRRLSAHCLVAVGSGGSFTAASFHAWLHERVTGKVSYAITPYQVLHRRTVLSNSAVSILSAEGKNKDILGAFQSILDSEPKDVLAIALKQDAPLVTICSEFASASAVSFDMPWGKDGYLATNSLFATCIILYRAYQYLFPHVFVPLPANLGELLDACTEDFGEELSRFVSALPLEGHQPFAVIFGECGRIASIDIESKIAESALGSTQLADFRNFAHGRHLWAYRNQHNAAAIIIWSDEDQLVYKSLADGLPNSIPRLSMHLKGPIGWQIIASLWGGLKIIGKLGEQRNIDPGAPEVPDFGRRMYAFNAFDEMRSRQYVAPAEVAIVRKVGRGISSQNAQYARFLVEAYEQFKQDLSAADFAHLILDYDATLCSPDNRFDGLTGNIAGELARLVSENVVIGVATGRGKSVLKDLRKVIPEPFQNRVWVGLYNGGLILRLDEQFEKDDAPTDAKIKKFYDLLTADKFLSNIFECELRPRQLTLNTRDPTLSELAWRAMNEVLASSGCVGLKAVRSTHSWDVVSTETSKVCLVEFLEKDKGASLCIGDRGLWPGNDYELLACKYSLSVDEVSPLENGGWNIAPAGLKGVTATHFYLRQLIVKNGAFKFRVEEK